MIQSLLCLILKTDDGSRPENCTEISEDYCAVIHDSRSCNGGWSLNVTDSTNRLNQITEFLASIVYLEKIFRPFPSLKIKAFLGTSFSFHLIGNTEMILTQLGWDSVAHSQVLHQQNSQEIKWLLQLIQLTGNYQ